MSRGCVDGMAGLDDVLPLLTSLAVRRRRDHPASFLVDSTARDHPTPLLSSTLVLSLEVKLSPRPSMAGSFRLANGTDRQGNEETPRLACEGNGR